MRRLHGRFPGRLRQLVRYSAVSAVATTTSLVVLGVLVWTRTTTAGWANVIATAVGTVPSFELNRRWVWKRDGARSVWAEVVPYAALAFAGLALSTIAVARIGLWADHVGLGDRARTVAVELANLAAFGTLWVLQFVVLDRVLFRSRHHPVRQDDGMPPRSDAHLVSR